MKFISVIIENFGTIAEAEVELNDRGLVLIQGDNQTNSASDSNGSGKSTVFEAISWCLYGKTAKGQTGDSVINRTAGKNCAVFLRIEDDGDEYMVSRGRKHKDLKSNLHVTTDGGKTVLTKGNDKLTQEVVNQLIGCPYEVFVGAIYAGQEKMPNLPGMTDKELKLLIEEAAGITLLDQAYTIAKQRLNDNKSALELGERQLENAEHAFTRAQDRLDDAKTAKERWEAERDARIIDVETNARLCLRDAKAAKAQLESMKSESDIETERRLLKNKMDKRDKEVSKLEELEKAEAEAIQISAGAKSAAELTVKGFKRIEAELVELQGRIGEPCDSCGRAHDETSLKSALTAKQTEVEKSKAAAKDAIKRAHGKASEAKRASQNVESFKNDMTDMREALTHSEALSEQLATIKAAQTSYDTLIERIKEMTQKIKDEKAKDNPNDADIADRQAVVKSNAATRKKMRDDIEPAKKLVEIAKSVVAVYSPKGVRAHILDTVTPYLNERTAHYLGALTDGEFEAIWQTITLTAKGEARENFTINVTGDDGKGSFVDLSGGEKRKVRIACSLALQDLVATRATKSLGLFVADEVDDALDTSALERLMGVLDEKAKEKGSVFIISHNDLVDWVSNVITVRKVAGVSTVTV